eukprot:1130039-Rhodomonas_salina.1
MDSDFPSPRSSTLTSGSVVVSQARTKELADKRAASQRLQAAVRCKIESSRGEEDREAARRNRAASIVQVAPTSILCAKSRVVCDATAGRDRAILSQSVSMARAGGVPETAAARQVCARGVCGGAAGALPRAIRSQRLQRRPVDTTLLRGRAAAPSLRAQAAQPRPGRAEPRGVDARIQRSTPLEGPSASRAAARCHAARGCDAEEERGQGCRRAAGVGGDRGGAGARADECCAAAGPGQLCFCCRCACAVRGVCC